MTDSHDRTSYPALFPASSWERPAVSSDGGDAALVVRIVQTQGVPPPATRAPIDVAFALDRSGSMAGEKLALVKQAIAAALGHLSGDDRAALVSFDHEAAVLHPLQRVGEDGAAALRRALDSVEAGGSTNLSGGWLTACQQLAPDAADGEGVRLRRALLLTDGLANAGITDVGELAHHAHQLRQRGIATTTIGVGEHFDELLLGGMAEAGGGTFQYIAHPSELPGFFQREIGGLLEVIAVRPHLRLDLPYGMQARLLNAFPSVSNGSVVDVDLRDLARGDEVALVFEITVAPGAEETKLTPMISLHWTKPANDRLDEVHSSASMLRRLGREALAEVPYDEHAREIVAMERAARDHREAIRLDREGRFAESRARFRDAGRTLAAAPRSARVERELRVSEDLASQMHGPLDEHTRKQRVFEAQRRSRGTRRNEE